MASSRLDSINSDTNLNINDGSAQNITIGSGGGNIGLGGASGTQKVKITGNVYINDATASTTDTTGALILDGGIGISKTTDATSSTNGGTFTTAGGFGVTKKGYFGGLLTAEAGLTSTAGITTLGATDISGIITSSNTTDSSSVSTGAINTTGGLGVAKTVFVGENFVSGTTAVASERSLILRNTSSSSNAYTMFRLDNDSGNDCGFFLNSSARSADGGANTATIRNDAGNLRLQSSTAQGITISSGAITLDNTTDATNSTSGGALTNPGGLAVAKKGYFGGLLTAEAGLTSTAGTTTLGATTIGAITGTSATFSSTVGVSGVLNMNSNKIINLPVPVSATDASNKQYVDSIAQGLDFKQSVRVATTTAQTLATDFENGDTIDSVTIATNDRILIKNQSTATENGIYVVNSSGAPTRSVDFPIGTNQGSAFVFVQEGTVNQDSGWVVTNNTPNDIVGTNGLVFVQFSGAGQIIAGTGLTKTGNELSVNNSLTHVTSIGTLTSLSAGATTLSSTLGVTGLITASGGLTSTAGTTTLGTTDVSGIITSNNTTATTSSTTGALKLAGGICISNTTDATSSTNGGTFTTAGGLAIAKKLYVGTDITLGGSVISTGGISTLQSVTNGGFDFVLGNTDQSSRGNSGQSRAFAKDIGNVLKINFEGDFSGGTVVNSTLTSTGLLTASAGLTSTAGTTTLGTSTIGAITGTSATFSSTVGVTGLLTASGGLTSTAGTTTLGATTVGAITGTSATFSSNVTVTGTLTASHSGLTGLSADDHTQYTLLAGRSGGQTLIGGTASGNNLILRSTSNASKGSIVLDETTATTSSTTGALTLAGGIGISNTTDATSSTNGGTLTTAGGVGIAKQLYVGSDFTIGSGNAVNSERTILIRNDSTGTSAVATIRLQNGGADDGLLFFNGQNRSTDGGSNLLTLRNNLGDLRLQTNGSGGSSIILNSSGITSLSNTTSSTNSTSGALTLVGGIGINNTTDATSSTNGGTFTTSGGLAVAKKGYFGGLLTAEAGLTSTAGTTTLGATTIGAITGTSATLSSTLGVTGLITASGGLTSTAGTTTLGATTIGAITGTSATFSTSLGVTGLLTASGGLTSTAGTTTLGTTNISGVFTSSNSTVSTSTATGSIVTPGGVGIGEKLFVGNNTSINGQLDMNSNKIINLSTPVAGTDAANKNYVDIAVQGLSTKQSVITSTTSPLTLATDFENGDIIDGVTLATGNRILIKNQTTATENGIYIVQASGAPVRSVDFALGSSQAGSYVFVIAGIINADYGFVLTNDAPNDVVGTNNLVFTQFSGAGQIAAGTGLTKTGNELSVNASLTHVTSVGTLTALTAGATTLNSTLNVSGIITSSDTTSSTSSTTGALKLAGSIAISNTTDATSSTNGGTFTTAGGLAVTKKGYFGGLLTAENGLTVSSGSTNVGSINASSLITSTDTTNSTSVSTGAINTTGGLGVAKSVFVGENLVSGTTPIASERSLIVRNTSNSSNAYTMIRLDNDSINDCVFFLNSSTRISDGGANTATIRNEIGNLRLQGSTAQGITISSGAITLDSTTDATNSTSGGALTNPGGLAVAKKGYFGGLLTAEAGLTSTAGTTTLGTTDVSGIITSSNTTATTSSTTGALKLAGGIGISNTTDATSSTNGGSFTTAGGLAVAKKLYVGTDITLGGSVISTGGISTLQSVTNGGFDFVLGNTDQSSRGNSGQSRAFVKDIGNVLKINFASDFTGGTLVDSTLTSTGLLTASAGLTSTAGTTTLGATTIGAITGTSATFSTTIGVTGLITASGGLTSTAGTTTLGATTIGAITGTSATFSTTLGVTGLLTASGGLTSTAGTTTLGITTIGAITGTSATLSSTLGVTGLITASGGLTSTAGTTTLGVTTIGAITGTSATFSTTLGVTGLITASGGLTSTAGTTTLGATTIGAITGTSASFSTTLGVTGLITASGGLTSTAGTTTLGATTIGAITGTSATFSTTLGVTGLITASGGLTSTAGTTTLGTTDVSGIITSSNTTATTSSTTGALKLAGGIGISNTTDATSSTNGGTFTTAGGLAVAKKLYVGTDITLGGSVISTGGISTLQSVTNGGFDFVLGNTDQSSRGNSGQSRAFVKDTGNILKINFASDFTGGTLVDSTLTSTGLLTASAGLTSTAGATTLGATTIGAITGTSATFSTTIGVTGLITASGGLTSTAGTTTLGATTIGAITGTSATFSTTLGVTGLITASGGLTSTAGTTTLGTTNVSGVITSSNTTDSSSVSTGAINTTGGLGVAKTVFVGENFVSGTTPIAGERSLIIGNTSSSSNAYTMIRLDNDSANDCGFFLNSSARSADGGANTATIRNDAGNLRLQSSGSQGITISSGAITLDNTTDATSSTNGGALTNPGGLAIAKKGYFGGLLTAEAGFTSSAGTTTLGTTNVSGVITSSDTTTTTSSTTGALKLAGSVAISNTTDASSSTNGGTFTTAGGLAIAKKLYVGSDITIGGSIISTGGISTQQSIVNGGFDFVLGNTDQSSRGNSGSSRAFVKDTGNVLKINYANDFSGGTVVDSALNVNGALSKTSGTFNIKHPNPVKREQGYRLRHSFVESNTRGDNLYRYTVQTIGCKTVIELPDYFYYLNENTQVFVSAINVLGLCRGYIDEDGKVQIETSVDGTYNVLVIGTRKDEDAVNNFDPKGVEYIEETF